MVIYYKSPSQHLKPLTISLASMYQKAEESTMEYWRVRGGKFKGWHRKLESLHWPDWKANAGSQIICTENQETMSKAKVKTKAPSGSVCAEGQKMVLKEMAKTRAPPKRITAAFGKGGTQLGRTAKASQRGISIKSSPPVIPLSL